MAANVDVVEADSRMKQGWKKNGAEKKKKCQTRMGIPAEANVLGQIFRG